LLSFIQSGKCTQRSKTVLKDFKTPCPDEIGCKCPKGAEKEEVEEDYSCYEKINEFCWEMKSGFNEATRVLTGECVETKARNTAKQCEKLGYYVSPEECRKKLPKDGGQTYCFELNKTSGCKGISKFDICFEENGSIKQGFYATSGQCSDELEKKSLEKGQKCTDENCYCTESSYGNIIKNGECCGPSWGYDIYDKNIHECTPTNGYARDKIYCSINDCQTDRVRVILKKVCGSIGANEDCDSNEYVNVANNGTVCVSHNGSCKWVEDEKFLRHRNDYFLSCKIDDCGTPSGVGIPGQNSKLVSSVQAEENEVKGMDILYFPEEGVYKVETVNGGTLSVLGGKENKYLLYYDRNGQEGYQSPEDPQNPKEDDDLLVSQAAVVVKTEKILNTNQVNVRKGINIISFDFLPMLGDKRGMNFSDFLKIANSKGDTISRISGFSGGSWQGGAIYDFNTKEVNGLSSELLTFGKGYVLLAIKDGTISIPGYKIESAVPIAFSSGWNLVGVHGYSTAYTAKTFIESINTIEGLKANNVTWWPTSRGMYQGYQLQNGQEYGQDFPISPINGYFVRIAEFTPKEDTCKSLIWNPSGEMNGECGSNN